MFWIPGIPAAPRPRPVPTVCRAIGSQSASNMYYVRALSKPVTQRNPLCLVMSGIMSNVAALVVCVAVTMGLRWLSLRFDIKSPTEEDIARFLHRKK